MKRCKDCKKWVKTSNLADDPNPSGKCNGRDNYKHEGYGTHASTEACYDFEDNQQYRVQGYRRKWYIWLGQKVSGKK